VGLRFAEEVYTFGLKMITTIYGKAKGKAIAGPACVFTIIYNMTFCYSPPPSS
jgi:hypothetical protein